MRKRYKSTLIARFYGWSAEERERNKNRRKVKRNQCFFFFFFSQVISTKEDLSLSRSQNDRSNSTGRRKFDLQGVERSFYYAGESIFLRISGEKERKNVSFNV